MDEWYSGVIEEQESSEGAEGADGDGDAAAEPVVLSKVVYDDGDVEVLDLVGGVEKVILLTYVRRFRNLRRRARARLRARRRLRRRR